MTIVGSGFINGGPVNTSGAGADLGLIHFFLGAIIGAIGIRTAGTE